MARSRVAWCIVVLLAAASAAPPSLGGGKGDMIDKSTIMLEGILKSVEAGDVLEPGPLVYLQTEADRENPMAMSILGWYRLKRNQWETGLSLLEKSADKDYIRAQLVLAQTALSQKNFPGARNWIGRACANRDSADFPTISPGWRRRCAPRAKPPTRRWRRRAWSTCRRRRSMS